MTEIHLSQDVPQGKDLRATTPERLTSHALALVLAVAGAAAVTGLQLFQATSAGIPNADDAVRLVQVRDLLSGQSWFDLTQYRLGLADGTPMHWSRLVDAPIAAIVVVAEAITGSRTTGEVVARTLWPALMLVAALAAVGHGLNRLLRTDAMPIGILVGAIALMTTGIFSPGALDHHNIQVALALWLLVCLLPGKHAVRHHAIAGLAAALMLGIGMETLPYVTLAGLFAAGTFVFATVPAKAARAFGFALFGGCAAILAATIPLSQWVVASCDAFSIFHLAMAACGGMGLAATASVARTGATRLAGLAATGAVTATVVLAAFPQCLSNPLHALDPLLITFWLEGVVETRSLGDVLSSDPWSVIGLYGMGSVALVIALLNVTRGHQRAASLLLAVLLATAFAVTAWQQRGSMFLTAFAILPMALVVADARFAASRPNAASSATIAMALAWVAALNISWWMASAQGAMHFGAEPIVQAQTASASRQKNCYSPALYGPLATEPAGVVLGATDLGASILTLTPHRAIAGPYHRNTAGNLLLIKTMLAKAEMAQAMVQEHGITHIAHCPGSADARDFAKAAPAGLQSDLSAGHNPDWLVPLSGTAGQALVIYRVLPATGKSG